MLQLSDISRTYRTTDIETLALCGIHLSVNAGEFVALMGPSGCGKSTLLNVLGFLDRPTGGSYRFLNDEVAQASENERIQLRRSAIGFVFQSFNLIDDLTVAENVEVSLLYRKTPSKERRARVARALEQIGMSHRARHFPAQLSGGEQQRVAIARALVAEPKLLLADEPTGNLDSANGAVVLKLLSEAAKSGTTIVMATHSAAHAAIADRTVKMLDGRVVSDTQMGTEVQG